MIVLEGAKPKGGKSIQKTVKEVTLSGKSSTISNIDTNPLDFDLDLD